MPRTKVAKTITTKRVRQPTDADSCSTALRELENKCAAFQTETDLVHLQVVDKLNNAFEDIRRQLDGNFLKMTLAEVCGRSAQTTEVNTTSASVSSGGKFVKFCDEGYVTESSCHSSILTSRRAGRPLGPLASAKAKRTQSVEADNFFSRTQVLHKSRLAQRTPETAGRLNTRSVDRDGNWLVTPKIKPNMPVSMLRYQRLGETIISMDGSPVIAQALPGSDANINIPVENGVISIVPSVMSSVEPGIISQMSLETRRQLEILRSNLNLMMSQLE